jgi:RNA polymerase sigma-70 factor (sigma-E family)
MMGAMAAERVGEKTTADRDDLLRTLFQGQYHSLVRLACLLLDDRSAGEDVVQDAFVKLHGSAHRIEKPAAAPAYLRSIVLNLARSQLRRRLVVRRHRPDRRGHAPAADAPTMLREDQEEVLAALRSLPRRQRECLALRYLDDLPEAEIAATLGISAGSVKTHTSRGLAALASRLEARQ